ncbi:sulfide:quinone oxidoreductase [Arcanobacterium wilhelmae]|uniref:Sulfide:quinone oxidoreductase n=1 Tax=Arcanobacterium wilhelmae TaxID=1803177 RepID=A0ABT9NBT5_9ACTO|nr:FAD/NAD(P)-binding oxidoreductase [Arcanobacterium wilhelmae]MDP9800676.1 sulfide:quinone oxidoreductase [Arcanobacterium wilhelmae]WFN90077.1 FAD/NAD(P)-binding oxidoreductase [Arcanobacterium wilhelmae]
MADIVVLGAGVAGHTAALHLRRLVGQEHNVTVVTPNSHYNWIPSNIWVGVGKMPHKKVVFPLAPIYKRKKINYVQAKAFAIHPQGDSASDRGFVEVERTSSANRGELARIPFDYLVNATGPRLNFAATEGLGPDGFTVSVCTADHAVEAAKRLAEAMDAMRAGKKQTIVIGTGHGTCTCQGAAFEYLFNVEHEIREAGLRDMARIIYLTNEHQLGDFGVGGMTFKQNGFETTSELWTSSLFRERGVEPIVAAAVQRVEEGKIFYETIDGEKHELEFDFSMLIPPFSGQPFNAYDREGNDITSEIFAPSGFMKVDADYSPKPFEEWRAEDWPETYEVPGYPNMFAAGIAFAPPHQISKPGKSPNGTVIAPAPPRTGMPSGMIGKAVAVTIANRIKDPKAAAQKSSMAHMGAACVASAGTGLRKGTAAAMTMYPVVKDYETYETGRDMKQTTGQIGLYGHWVKLMLHYLFIYKAKALPGWQLIPE